MSSNPWFRQFRVRGEQNLVDDLIKEVIQIFGIDMLYLPRSKENLDLVFGEDVLNKFDDYYDLEMYIEPGNNFKGPGDILESIAGFSLDDRLTLCVSRTRFFEQVGSELERPREGDLIYEPMTDSLFEIKFVEHEDPFYQLGDLAIFKFEISKFVFSNEKIDTGLEEIDDIESEYSYKINLVMSGGAGDYEEEEIVFQGADINSATAKAEVVCWNVEPNTLEVMNIVGEFDIANGPVIGEITGASYTLVSSPDELDFQNNKVISDNRDIEDSAKEHLDTDENDPFGFLDGNS